MSPATFLRMQAFNARFLARVLLEKALLLESELYRLRAERLGAEAEQVERVTGI